MTTKCGKQYCNYYCKEKKCVDMDAKKLAEELGIKMKMNWDTKETWRWITNESYYSGLLQYCIGDEMFFIHTLYDIIDDFNGHVPNERLVETAKVNGNELYVKFCELCGREQEGWK